MSDQPTVTASSPLEPHHGQWSIGDRAAKPHASFNEVQLAGSLLFVHPSLPVVRVLAAGQTVGWLLGSPISIERRQLINGELRLDAPIVDADQWVETHIYALAGSWIFVLDRLETSRLYLDCAGSLSAVYEPERRRAGATAESILAEQDYASRLLTGRVAELEVSSDGWIGGYLTAHEGVRRLLANHYLDLERWQVVRHWPTRPLEEDLSAEESARRLSAAGAATIEATATAPKAFMALTGGYDTRVVLSMSRSVHKQLEFATIAAPGAERDVHLARELARKFGLRYRVLPFVAATEAQKTEWDHRVGHVVTGANRAMHPTLWALSDCFWIGGVGGEVGRGFLWMDTDDQSMVSAVNIIDRLKLPRQTDLVASVEAWLASLPAGMSVLSILDLAFIELRNSSWAFGQAYSNPVAVKINPLNSRAAYKAMLRSPPADRRGNILFQRVIDQNWPELLSVPVNRYGDIRDKLDRLKTAVRRPDKVLRKARQLLRTGQR